MSKYTILECRYTFDLMLWGADLYGVWVPTQVVRRVAGRGASKRMVDKRVAVMPGYAFVPEVHYGQMYASAHPKYRLRVMHIDPWGHPATCDLKDLSIMAALLTQQETEAGQRAVVFNPGQRVEVVASPFAGFEGVVQEGGTALTLRILLGNRYVNLPYAYVKCIG